jgi:asparaginyl-tRNA synthetase
MRAIREYLDGNGFVELLPPIIGPVTDPGIRGARQATVDFYGRRYKVMSSAILYKQMMAGSFDRIYFFSPNIRIEPLESALTGRHLAEFVQTDLEIARASYLEAMEIAEEMLVKIICRVKEINSSDLAELGRRLDVPARPFPRISHAEAVRLLNSNGYRVDTGREIPWNEEAILSGFFKTPFFIYDYPMTARGFYDKEDLERPGMLRDFDMLYSEGYGEAASGAEREHDYDSVVKRIRCNGEDPAEYGWYLDMLRDGVPPTAGFGIGVERLTRFICGLSGVWEARPSPKVPGIYSP